MSEVKTGPRAGQGRTEAGRRLLRPWILVPALLVAVLAGHQFAKPAEAEDPLRAARERFGAEVGPTDPAAYRPPAVDEEDNGARWFLAGAASLHLPADDGELLRSITSRRPAEWSADEAAWLSNLVARESAALALLHRGARSSASSFPAVPTDPQEPPSMDPFLDLQQAARFLLAAGLLELEDPAGGSPSLDSLAALADALYAQPELLYRLMAVAVETHLLTALHHAAETPDTGVALLRSLADRLPGRPADETFAHTVAFVAAEAASRLEAEGSEPQPEERLAAASVLDELRRMALAAREPGGFQDLLHENIAQPDTTGRVITALLMPNVGDLLTKLQAVEASRRLAHAAVEARSAAADAGAYPSNLATASPNGSGPFAGTDTEVRLLEDGSLILADPAAATAWAERTSANNLPPLPFHWHLPAPR